MKNIFAFSLLVIIGLGIVYLAVRPSEAEYHSCMVTMTDKTICESVKPK